MREPTNDALIAWAWNSDTVRVHSWSKQMPRTHSWEMKRVNGIGLVFPSDPSNVYFLPNTKSAPPALRMLLLEAYFNETEPTGSHEDERV